MMTRQHFQALADALRASNAPGNVRDAIACTLASFNPRFDRERFIRAATPEAFEDDPECEEREPGYEPGEYDKPIRRSWPGPDETWED